MKWNIVKDNRPGFLNIVLVSNGSWVKPAQPSHDGESQYFMCIKTLDRLDAKYWMDLPEAPFLLSDKHSQIDLVELSEKYRKERNRLMDRCRHLERRQKCDKKRIGELKTMLSENGIDWRNQ